MWATSADDVTHPSGAADICDMHAQAVGVTVVNFNHQLVWVNEAYASLVGYAANELIGKTFEDITHPEDADLDRDLARRLFAGEIDHYTIEKRYIHREGSVVPVHVKVSMIRDRRGGLIYATACVERLSCDLPSRPDGSGPLTEEHRETERIRRAMMRD